MSEPTSLPADVSSIGHAASILSRHPTSLRRVLSSLGCRPAITINGVDHFRAADIERVARYFDQQAKQGKPNP